MMARPAKPKTHIAQRLIEARGNVSRDEFASSIGVIPGTYANYERGDAEPNLTVLQSISQVHGINLHWLLTGNGATHVGGDVKPENTTLADIRRYVWNITATFWETVPRRTKPESVADQAVEMLDYLVSREGVNEEAVSEVIQFEAERLKRSSDTSD